MNNDIIKRPMQDVIVSRANSARTTSSAPSSNTPSVNTGEPTDISDRIAKSSFFGTARPVGTATPFIPEEKKGHSWSRRILWILFILLAGGGFFVVADYFVKATVTVVPTTYSATLKHEFIAVKNSEFGAPVFQFMSLSEDRMREIPAEEEQKIQKKASGTVIIYNAYNEKSQRLITNTRLESSDHKIFRIATSVVVPGARVSGGKVIPGSVETVVYADAPGSEYNIGLTDFTIPGFKGDPRYEKFTARTQASAPIGGGFDGTVKVPKEEDKEKARTEIKEELTNSIMGKARAEIPEGSIFFPGSTVLSFEDIPQELTAESAAQVSVRATVSIFFFNEAEITKTVAEAVLPDYRGGPLAIPHIESLNFSFITPVENTVLTDLSQIKFTLSGEPLFVGIIDTQKFIQDLVGKERKDFAKIVTGEENVKKAEATIRPFWVTTFPADPTRISIKLIEGASE